MLPRPSLRLPLTALFVALAATLQAATPARPPNVIVILADELGYGDVGFNGAKEIPTPGLNRVAAGGVVFTSAYVSHPNSSANRAGLLTGRYPQRFGHERALAWRPQDPSVGLPAAEKTLAEALRPLGYTSGLIGKWHLGAHDNFHPNNRGFEEFYGFLGGGRVSFPELQTIRYTHEARNEPESYRTWTLRGMEPVRSERHLTEDLSIEAVDFVRRHSDKPFFLYLSYNAPRSPLQAPDNEIAAFNHIANEKRRAYAAMVVMMDRGVGRLLDLLDAENLSDNTLLFFLSSSGGDTAATGAYNGNVRGMRGEPTEGGIRVPFAVRWPGRIPGGTVYRKPVSTLDIFATVAAASGIPADPARPLDGVDLVPFLSGKNDGNPHENLFFRVFDSRTYMMRQGPYKLIKTQKAPEPQLFNLANDPMEKTNVAASQPERVQAMLTALDEWNAGLIDPVLPGVNMNEWKQPQR